MVDNRAISWADTKDPAACNLNDSTGNWMDESRDPERKNFYIYIFSSFFFSLSISRSVERFCCRVAKRVRR